MATTIKEFTHLQIPLEEIVKATNNFGKIIGKGDFGVVYKGKLMHSGKLINIAARRLDRRRGRGDVEFLKEISVLASFKHKNIVSLIGFCDEKGEKIIVNHHYPKGSLSRHLSNPTLTWNQRLSICLGLLDAIYHLHVDLASTHTHCIIHRNINSTTILLDNDWSPKLSGFEYSILHSPDRQNQVLHSEPIGTQGYIDPAVEKEGGVTYKSDIYCVGVVLFEILSGRKANEDNKLLVHLAKFHYENETLKEIIHPDLWNQMEVESFVYFSKVAYDCLDEEPAVRPRAGMVRDEIRRAKNKQEKPAYSADAMKRNFRAFQNALEDKRLMQDLNNALDELQRNRYVDDENRPSDMDEFFKYIVQDWRNRHGAENRPSNLDEDEEDDLEEEQIGYSKVTNNEHLRIGLRDIELATNNFSETCEITSTSDFSVTLYRVELECFDREYISFVEGKNIGELPKKRYTVKIKRIRDKEYLYNTEIEVLSSCKHHNIESLLGFCDEGPDMILIYEYTYELIQTNYFRSPWENRLKICIDVAKALNYLHNEMEDQKMVIHRGITPMNIVLDNYDSRAKISGFGHCVLLHSNSDGDALDLIEIAGDRSYMDPEYVKIGKPKRESDVFSFGLLMFDILSGDTQCDKSGNQKANLARRWYDNQIIWKIIDDSLLIENVEDNFFLHRGPNKDSLETFSEIAYRCLAETQNQRPRMETIIEQLEKALSFQENHKDPFKMSLEEIKLATNDFSHANKVGEGGFGRVYRGELSHEHGYGHSTIVAKQLDTNQGQGETQYYNELQVLYEYKHDNIIGLVGYSNETKEKIIVYEHASKGSLDRYLKETTLTWRNRLDICIDAATGLDFLHGGIQGQKVVIHRDIKTANILLFDDWKAKLGDFGLSLITTINKETSFTVDHACGTKDYVDPLYLQSGLLTVESDIYSFGVVLFEMLCGRPIYAIHKSESQSLRSFIKHNFEDGKQDEVVFQAIKKEIVPKSLSTFLNVVYKCLEYDREKRPTANEVVAELKKALEFQDSLVARHRQTSA